MGWDEYKALCDRPNVMSRWMLEQTAEVLEHAARADLGALLDVAGRNAVPKPADHRGGALTDMFELDLDRAAVNEICQVVASGAASGMTTRGTGGRGLGGFAEAWDEYRRWLLHR